MNGLALLALLVAAAGGGRTPPAPAIPDALRELRPDGSELVVLPVPLAGRSSLRYVVRAGSALDPPGKEGLAHLLEHLAADAGARGGALFDVVRVAGGELNAFTSPSATVYALDAPSPVFPGLAERLIRTVSSPRLERAEIAREQAIISTEAAYAAGDGVLGLIEHAMFRTPVVVAADSPDSQERLSRDDLVRWFQTHYATSNTTLVFTGDVTPEAARTLLDRAMLLPPALPAEEVVPISSTPGLPLEQRIPAPFNAAVVGYALAPEDAALCDPLGSLLELRAVFSLRVQQPILGYVSAGCRFLRGTPFLFVLGFSRSLEAGDLPSLLERVLQGLSRSPLTASERTILERRRRGALATLRGDAQALADAVADLAAGPQRDGRTELSELGSPLPGAGVLRAAARRATRADRRAQFEFSPFAQ